MLSVKLFFTGHINARILELFKFQDINSLSLSASVDDAGGLNMAGIDSLRGVSEVTDLSCLNPHIALPQCSQYQIAFSISLNFVSAEPTFLISKSGISVVSHPCLICNSKRVVLEMKRKHYCQRQLFISACHTEICIRSIFLLLPLKTTLKRLNISANPYITDAAVPALILLSNLLYVSLIETSINMPGLRLYASAVYTEDRAIDIEIPSICEQYIDSKFSSLNIS